MAARARLDAIVTLDTTRFGRGLNSIRRSMGYFNSYAIQPVMNFGKRLLQVGAAAGAGLAAGLTALVVKTASFGEKIQDMNKRTGLSVEELQRYAYAADQTGGSMEGVEAAVRGMSKTVAEAGNGSKSAAQDLSQLGLKLDDLKGQTTDQVFSKMLDAVAKLPDPIQRSAAAMKIFGRGGKELTGMLAEGAAGIANLKAAADRMGIVFGAENIANAAAFKDEVDRTQSVLASLGRAVVMPWLPAIRAGLEAFRNAMVDFGSSGAFAALVDQLKNAVAFLLAATEVFVKTPDKFKFLFDMIVLAFKTGAQIAAQAIKSAFTASPAVGGLMGGMVGKGLGGAAGGALMGSRGGPWGALIGAVVGAAAGLIGSKLAAKKGNAEGFKKVAREAGDEFKSLVDGAAKEAGLDFDAIFAKYKNAAAEAGKAFQKNAGGGPEGQKFAPPAQQVPIAGIESRITDAQKLGAALPKQFIAEWGALKGRKTEQERQQELMEKQVTLQEKIAANTEEMARGDDGATF